MPDRVDIIVLAAGLSSRFGRPKQLEILAGDPLVVHTVRKAQAAATGNVIVVVGAEADRVRDALVDLPVSIVDNPAFASGQASSLIAGISHAQANGADAVIVLLADQPGIDPDAIVDLQAARASGALVGMAEYGAERGHPVMFGHELFPELLALSGDAGGREVVRRHQADLVLVSGRRSTVPADLDREDDRAAVLAELEASDARDR